LLEPGTERIPHGVIAIVSAKECSTAGIPTDDHKERVAKSGLPAFDLSAVTRFDQLVGTMGLLIVIGIFCLSVYLVFKYLV
jgi:hypothetical protein